MIIFLYRRKEYYSIRQAKVSSRCASGRVLHSLQMVLTHSLAYQFRLDNVCA